MGEYLFSLLTKFSHLLWDFICHGNYRQKNEIMRLFYTNPDEEPVEEKKCQQVK